MKITKHAQSCLLVESANTKILIDPGVFVTEKEKYDINNFTEIDAIIITHQHSDHFSPENLELIIANNPNVPIFTTRSVRSLFEKPNVKVICDQGVVQVKNITITGVTSKHGPVPNGTPTPEVIGVLINDGSTTFYDPSDSIELFATADVVAEPICGVVVMDIQKAKEEALRTQPKIVFPIHFDNPAFPVVPEDFPIAMEGTGVKCVMLDHGESVEL